MSGVFENIFSIPSVVTMDTAKLPADTSQTIRVTTVMKRSIKHDLNIYVCFFFLCTSAGVTTTTTTTTTNITTTTTTITTITTTTTTTTTITTIEFS